MGQKVNPIGLRVGLNKDWDSTWYADNMEDLTTLFIKCRQKNFCCICQGR